MSHYDLYKKLKKAYSDVNLNSISAKIIELYKAKEYEVLREIIQQVSEFLPIHEEKISKCFSQLIMLYHPDKGLTIRNELDQLYASGNFEKLKSFQHILSLHDIDKIVVEKAYDIDEEFVSEYIWDENVSGFHIFTEEKEFIESDHVDYGAFDSDNSFFSAAKRKFYGYLDVDLPQHYLADFDDVEMTGFEIDDLDGVRFCKHVRDLNLSNNYITDISELQYLKSLEDLYLANNQIGIIDPIIACKKLKTLDLSHNNIDDISSLLSLPQLHYVNLIGNPVPAYQIEELKSKNIIVIA